MGNEKKESAVQQLDDILGIGDESTKNEQTPAKEENKEQTPSKEETPKKDETPTQNTTVVTDEQVAITKNIAKIDLQIESLESENVDTNKFYENIDEHLSEDEVALEFSDKSAYMKLINTKLKEFETKNSKTEEIERLKAEKTEQESIYERQSAITEVIAKHPTYNHEDVMKFFKNDLSASEQQKIYDASNSYADVYEKSFEKFTQSNPANISQEKAPNIPNVNNTRKQQLKTNDIEESLMGDDDKIQEALGL